jgi:hypothetical protein
MNAIYFGTRKSTHDLDLYNESLKGLAISPNKLGYLPNLESEWFNNYIFIPKRQREAPVVDTITQNEGIFKALDLTVLAAPWQYVCLCAKLGRSNLRFVRHSPATNVRHLIQEVIQYTSPAEVFPSGQPIATRTAVTGGGNYYVSLHI